MTAGAGPSVADPELPRTLRQGLGLKLLFAVMAGFFVFAAWMTWRDPVASDKPWLLGFCGLFVVVFGAGFVQAQVGGVTIDADGIEEFGLFGRRRLKRADIASLRQAAGSLFGTTAGTVILVPVKPRGRRMTLLASMA